jgi:hypothetical protein
MSALSISVPYPVFSGQDGLPLDNGYVWIGTANLYPITNPIAVYFDEALTIQATQPLRTINGFISNAGTPAQIYVDAINFSILVQDSKGTMVYNFPDGTGVDARYTPGPDSLLFPGGPISFDSALDQITDKDSGSSVIGFNQAGAGAVSRTVEAKLREYMVSVKDYGATGDGVTNDRAAINLAFDEVLGRGAGTVYFPAGTYRCTGTIGNVSGTTNRISIAVIGEAGAVISFDPAVAANVGLDLLFAELNIGIVKNLEIRCNNKVATGLRVRGIQSVASTPVLLVEVDGVYADKCKMVNDPSVTTAAAGISVSSNLGIICSVINCYVTDVSRDQLLFSTGIEANGFINTLIANNSIFNVTHGGITPLQDSDGIKVFNFNDGTDNWYRQSTVTIINNRILNCDGRFIKLQTNGNAVVENNTLSITTNINIINDFQFIDSQAGTATIINNKIQALSNWTGGGSSTVFSLPFAPLSNVKETNETFVTRCENNDFYTKFQRVIHGITVTVKPGSTAKMIHIVKNNTFSRDGVIDFTSNTANSAVARFMRITNTATPATFDGQWILDVGNNKVASNSAFITFGESNNDDYADKWFFYVYDNFLYSWDGSDVFGTSGGGSPLNNIPYTSTLMVRDNNIGSSGASRNLVRVPINVAKILSGSDFETGDSGAPTMTNVPANWRNGRIYKKGLVTGAENVNSATARHYLSIDNGTNWYQV